MNPEGGRLRALWRLWRGGLRASLKAGGRDVYETTRESVLSLEARSGAAVFAGLFLLSLLQASPPDFSPLEPGPALDRLLALSRASRLLFRAWILVVHLALGAFLGVLVRHAWEAAADLWPPLGRRLSARARAAWVAGAVLFLHGIVLTADMRIHPALYQPAFLARGGLSAWAQVFLTDRLPAALWAVLAVPAGVVFALAAAQIFRRFLRWFNGFPVTTRVASTVLGLGVALFFLGLWGVFRFHAPRNVGPNAVVLCVDGLRSDALSWTRDGRSLMPTLSDLVRRGRAYAACVPPLAQTDAALMTFFAGRTPLTHDVRHAFPRAQDVSLGPDSLPAVLRRSGYVMAAAADGGGGLLSRVDGAFHLRRAARESARDVFRREILRASVHLLPYLRGRPGRRVFPSLRGIPALADPFVTAREAESQLRQLRFEKKFFLLVRFSALAPPHGVSSRAATLRLDSRYQGPHRYALAGGPATGAAARVRALYEANAAAVDAAAGRLLGFLREMNLDESTLVVVWSPHGEQLGERDLGFGHGGHLRGREVLSAPLVFREPLQRTRPLWFSEPVRAQDVAPTLLSYLGLAVPEGMEGLPLQHRAPGDFRNEDHAAYSETDLWRRPGLDGPPPDRRIAYPDAGRMLEEDPAALGRLRLKSVWQDHVLSAKQRMIQMGPERLVYIPTPAGVVYELYDFSSDPDGLQDLARTRAGQERVRELREVFFRFLRREPGWRPQNEYWLPEAFLSESAPAGN